MNVTYKLIQNRNGHTVVASELAKGHKKNARIMLAALLFTSLVSSTFAADLTIEGQYNAAEFTCNGGPCAEGAKPNGHRDIDNNQKTTKILNQNTNINFGKIDVTSIDPNYHMRAFNLKELFDKGLITIFDNDGTTNPPKLTSVPTWTELTFNAKTSIDWKQGDEIHQLTIHDLENSGNKTVGPEYSIELLSTQPNIPYYNISFAKITNGTMNFADTANELNVRFPYIKNSSLFIADASQSPAAMVVGGTSDSAKVKMHVTFEPGRSLTDSLNTATEDRTFNAGPRKVYAQNITGTGLKFTYIDKDTGVSTEYTGDFTIRDLNGLKEYQTAIIRGIQQNIVDKSQYDSLFNLAFTTINSADLPYTVKYHYDQSFEIDDFYFTNEMKASTGNLSIFKVDHKGANITFNDHIDISAIGGHIVYGDNNAQITNNTSMKLLGNMGNVIIKTASNYDNKGTLVYGYDSDTGVVDTNKQTVYTILPDIVDTNSIYTNHKQIFVGTNNSTAIVVAGNGQFINEAGAKMYVASADSRYGHSNGVGLTNGNWENKGDIYLGKGISDQGILYNTNVTPTAPIESLDNLTVKGNKSNNVVYATSIASGNKIINSNNIIIGDVIINEASPHIRNAVGINIEDDSKAVRTDVTILNTGIIDVGGISSIGMRISGKIGDADENATAYIGNEGTINVSGVNSAGIFATNEAIVRNKGTINVYDSGQDIAAYSMHGNYGIRAESSATVYADGPINLKGNNSIGVFARLGAKVIVKSISSVEADASKEHIIHYWISGRNIIDKTTSSIVFADTQTGNTVNKLTLKNNNSSIFRIDNGAIFGEKSANVSPPKYEFTVAGNNSIGAYISDPGTKAFADENLILNVTGDKSVGIFAANGAGTQDGSNNPQGEVTLKKNAQITVSGTDAIAVVVDGRNFDLSGKALGASPKKTIVTSEATLDSNVAFNKGAIGYKLVHSGTLEHKGILDFTQNSNGKATGIYIEGGILNNNGTVKVDGVGVDIYGKNSVVENIGSVLATDGIAAIRLNKDATLTIKGSNTNKVVKGEQNADAVLVHAGSVLTTSNAQIEVDGKGAGIHFLNMDQDGSGQFKLSGSGTITVKGNDATGILVEGEDVNGKPTMGTSDFISDNSSGLIINVEDINGNGITVNTSGKVHSGASVNIKSKQGQSALVLKGDTTQITQSGNLSSNSETSAVVELKDLTSTQDINFTNLGSIKVSSDANAPTGLVAINADIGKNINITNGQSETSKGEITGVIALGDQKNQVTLFGGSKADEIVATTGETSIMLKDVQRGQSNNLFNKLTAGNGVNDAIELSATSSQSGKASHYALTQAKANEIKGFEQLKIHANSMFELDNSDITLNESAPDGGIHLKDATGILFVNQSQATGKNTFNHNLYGNGVLKTDINEKAFDFDANKASLIGDKFTGKLQLEKAKFTLEGDNTKALTKATLRVGQQSQTFINDGIGKQNIGGLAFDGGRLTFKDDIPNMNTTGQIADGSIYAKHLDLSNAKGTVDIHVGVINNTPTFDTKIPILEQDIGESIVQLVGADQVTGVSTGALKLDLYNLNGGLHPDSGKLYDIPIEQFDKKVANGKYGYGLQAFKNGNSTKADGLHVAYMLKEIELLTKGDGATILHAVAGKTGNGSDLAAKVTGAGDLIIATDSDYISLSNGSNDYTGITDVRKGGLVLENNDVLGQTSLLKLGEQTSVSIFGKETNKDGVTQAVGSVTSAQNSLIHLGNKGELTVKGDANSTIDGSIVGGSAAKLIFDKANNTVSSQNAGLASRVEINNDATLQTYHSTSIGNAGDVVIADDAKLLLGNYDTGNTGFSKALNGKGEVIITESLVNGQKTGSDIEFKADNSNFKGDITIGQATDTLATRLTVTDSLTLGAGDNVTINEQGTLNLNYNGTSDWKVDKNVTGAGDFEKDGAGTVELTAKVAQYTGTTTVKNGLLIAGTIDNAITLNSQLLNIEANGSFLGSGEIKGSVNNSGSFSIGRLDKVETDAAMKYTVNGDFTNQGIINLNVRYPDEDYTSKTNTNSVKHGNIGNELVITGNYIANGGSIYLNTVLNKGKGKGSDETSTDFITVGGDVIKQGSATQLFIQNYGGLGAATLPDAIKIVDVAGTSDKGSFILGKPATIGIYEYTLQKGKNDNSWYLSSNPDDPVIDPEKKINPRVGGYLANMAMAFEMFNVTLHDRLGNPDYGQGFLTGDEDGISAWGRIVTVHKNYTAVNKRLNISGDYYVAQVGADLIKVAAENDAQYRFGVMAGYGNSDFTSTSRHTSSKADAKIDQAMSVGIYGTWYQPESWFVDTWIQYSHFKNEISMKNSTTSKYNSDLISASIELGYNHRTDDLSNGDHLILQPNAQVIYGHLSTKEYEDMDSGLRVASNKKNNVQTRLGMKVFYIPKDSNFRPYVEGNWIYNSSNMGVNFNDKFTFSSNAPKSRYEVKLGVEGELSKEWSLWGNVSYQFGKDKYKGYKAMLGAKYTW